MLSAALGDDSAGLDDVTAEVCALCDDIADSEESVTSEDGALPQAESIQMSIADVKKIHGFFILLFSFCQGSAINQKMSIRPVGT